MIGDTHLFGKGSMFRHVFGTFNRGIHSIYIAVRERLRRAAGARATLSSTGGVPMVCGKQAMKVGCTRKFGVVLGLEEVGIIEASN